MMGTSRKAVEVEAWFIRISHGRAINVGLWAVETFI